MCINMASCEQWQNNKQKLSERGQYLLESGLWSDCNFLVGEEPQKQIFKGHKLFLAMSSPVFEAMFFSDMAEKNDPIPINDVQPEVFKILLDYIYTDKIEFSSFELACDLWCCANKYILPSLVEECIKYLSYNLSVKNVCKIYEVAKRFGQSTLLNKCLQIIRTKTNEVLKEPTWKEVELETLLKILDQDELLITSEVELFNAVEQWAKAECERKSLDPTDEKSLRSVIGNALLKIRFLSLTFHEFAIKIGGSPLLTKDETLAIIMNIAYGNAISMPERNQPMPENFSTRRNNRKPQNIQMLTVSVSQKTNISSAFVETQAIFKGTQSTFGTTPSFEVPQPGVAFGQSGFNFNRPTDLRKNH